MIVSGNDNFAIKFNCTFNKFVIIRVIFHNSNLWSMSRK